MTLSIFFPLFSSCFSFSQKVRGQTLAPFSFFLLCFFVPLLPSFHTSADPTFPFPLFSFLSLVQVVSKLIIWGPCLTSSQHKISYYWITNLPFFGLSYLMLFSLLYNNCNFVNASKFPTLWLFYFPLLLLSRQFSLINCLLLFFPASTFAL